VSYAVIIPARSGSKSIPKKNITPFLGRPLIAHTIEYALKSKQVDRVIVSTDSEEIAEISRNYGAETPFLRPKEIANDFSQDFDFMFHALNFFEKEEKTLHDAYVLLRPTSPRRRAGLIEEVISIFEKYKPSSIRAVTKVSEHPYRVWLKKNKLEISQVIPEINEPFNIPRQKLPEMYFQTGDIELVSRECLLSGSVTGDKVIPVFIDQQLVFDIDTPEDLIRAEND